jgi:hypothetical protein
VVSALLPTCLMIPCISAKNSGVADFGYDFYLLAIASLAVGIAKLLHGQYFRLLDFYFHTLIQQHQDSIILPLNIFEKSDSEALLRAVC